MLTPDRSRLAALLLGMTSLTATLLVGPWPGRSPAVASDPSEEASKKWLTRSPKPLANLLVNGSFEDGPEVSNYRHVDKGSAEIPGWTVIRGQIDYVGNWWKAEDGLRSLDLHGSPGYGGVAQEFSTVKGQRYRVTFALTSSGPYTIVKRVGVAAADKTAEFAVDGTGKTHENMGWVRKAWEFEAVAGRTTLEIYTLEKTEPFAGPALDDVRVVAVAKKK